MLAAPSATACEARAGPTRPHSPFLASAAPLNADDGADGASARDDEEDGGSDCESMSSTDTFPDADEDRNGDGDLEATAAVSDTDDKGEELETEVQGMPSDLVKCRHQSID